MSPNQNSFPATLSPSAAVSTLHLYKNHAASSTWAIL